MIEQERLAGEGGGASGCALFMRRLMSDRPWLAIGPRTERGHAPNASPAAPAQWGVRQLRLLLEEVEVEGGVAAMAEGEGLLSVDYEVSGKVQGVFFRKYTQVRGAGPPAASSCACQPGCKYTPLSGPGCSHGMGPDCF